jgi:hypothetical protein
LPLHGQTKALRPSKNTVSENVLRVLLCGNYTLSLTCCGKISDTTTVATGPFDQQQVNPKIKSIATSTIATGSLSLLGNAVVKQDRIKIATVWIPKPQSRSALRPKRSTVKVFTNTTSNCITAWMPLMTSAREPEFHPKLWYINAAYMMTGEIPPHY